MSLAVGERAIRNDAQAQACAFFFARNQVCNVCNGEAPQRLLEQAGQLTFP